MGRKHWLWVGAGAVVAAALGAGYLALREPAAFGAIAVAYAAKQTCTCLHVGARTLESCLADFPEDARARLKVTVLPDRVRASAYGLFSAEAAYQEGFGCRIER